MSYVIVQTRDAPASEAASVTHRCQHLHISHVNMKALSPTAVSVAFCWICLCMSCMIMQTLLPELLVQLLPISYHCLHTHHVIL